MTSLRTYRGWLALWLVLSMVSAMGGLPVSAALCMSSGVMSSAESGVCREMKAAGPCCCGPKAKQVTHPQANTELSQPDCGCSLKTPPAAPAADLTTSRVFSPLGSALLPQVAVSLVLPAVTPQVVSAALVLQPHATAERATAPRAPPAC
jgi:hypothetical protein